MIESNTAKAPAFSRARFARIYYIHKHLCSKKYPNVPILARQLEVSLRTVERDIEYMRDRLGAAILYCYKNRGYYYENVDFQLPPLRLTEGELMALFLGQKLLAQCTGTPLEVHVRSAFDKILTMMPEGVTVDWNTLEHAISFNVEPLRGNEQRVAKMYNCLAEAMGKGFTVWIRYYGVARDEINERYVDPYHLRYHQGAWYLIAYCHLRQAIRIFALDRIHEITQTVQHFTTIPDFSIEDYLYSALGIEFGEELQQVVIRFDRHQARWIRERCWHHTQSLEPQNDGSLILTMTVSSLNEVKRWALGFGCHAEVIEPLSLRQEIIDEVKSLGSIYNSVIKSEA